MKFTPVCSANGRFPLFNRIQLADAKRLSESASGVFTTIAARAGLSA
jgi:hypothetical protein